MPRDAKPDFALEFACPDCNAKPGELCGSIADASKYLDVPHAGRRKLVDTSSWPTAHESDCPAMTGADCHCPLGNL